MANFLRNLIENDKKELKSLSKIAQQVEEFAEAMANMSDDELKAKTPELRNGIKMAQH